MVIIVTFALEELHIKKLEDFQERLLTSGRMRRRNRSDALRIMIEDFILPDWSTDSVLPVESTDLKAA